jgi:signal peptidase II
VTRKDWIYTFWPLFLTWGLDQLTKHWANSIVGVKFHGPIGLVLHHNHGAMLGLFSDLPAVLRIVSLSTGGAFLLFTYVVVQYLLPIKSLTLRMGISFLLGGILGNVTDRIVSGYVTDFILLGTPTYYTPAFNLADALQWVGYFMLIFALFRDGEILWPANNARKQLWVNPTFQLKYCLTLTAVGLCLSVIAGVYSYTFLRVIIIELVGFNPVVMTRFLSPFIVTFTFVSLFFGVLLFTLARVLSHRTAGPVYAFERFLEDLLHGQERSLKLRAKDEFRHLEPFALHLAQKIRADQRRITALEEELKQTRIHASLIEDLELSHGLDAQLDLDATDAAVANNGKVA